MKKKVSMQKATLASVSKEPQEADPDYLELEAKVCREFCAGQLPSAIAKAFNLSREQPYKILQLAAQRRRLEYIPLLHFEQAFKLELKYPGLRARVVHSGISLDVAFQTASWLLELVQEHRQHADRSEIHIGFAGGGLLRETARLLSRMLRENRTNFENFTFVFHAMVAGFNSQNPMNDPNAFFGFFAGEPALQVRFIHLLAPGIVTPEAARTLRTIKAIEDAYKSAQELDIIVSSAGAHWNTGCSKLRQLYQEGNPLSESLAELQKAKTIGDILWRPISERGPVLTETSIRAMTLLDLPDLPSFISKKKKVLLVLAPCGSCGKPKGQILNAVLKWKERPITHVVLDSRAAMEALAH